jgi:hypothetical protein
LLRTESARNQINYQIWLTRCQIERTPEALEARRLMAEADVAFNNDRTEAAKDLYEQAFAKWRLAFDQFPSMIDNGPFREDIVTKIEDYKKVLAQLDQQLPADFVLSDVLEKNKKSY